MSRALAALAAVIFLGLLASPARAHRLDEYLQATTVDVSPSRVSLEIRLTPGVQVFPKVMGAIDTDGDGQISPAEQRAYAEIVLRDLSLTIDAKPVQPRLTSVNFPELGTMKEGLGDIVLTLEAGLPAGGPARKLVFENRHQRAISVYLVNCLVPRDVELHVTAQQRNYEQSVYRLDYTQGPAAPTATRPRVRTAAAWSSARTWLFVDAAAILAMLGLVWASRRQRREARAVPTDGGAAHLRPSSPGLTSALAPRLPARR